MKIAIPLYNNRVSPRFNHTDRLLIADIDGGEYVRKETVFAGDIHPLKRVRILNDLDVDVLICCGIDRFTALQFEYQGIDVYHGVSGDAEMLLERFMENDLEQFLMNSSGRNRCRKSRQKIRRKNCRRK